MSTKVVKSDEQWQQELTPEQFRITRKKGTERAFTGTYWNAKDDGVYVCVCCGQPLFDAKTKFDSGTGWPSFSQPLAQDKVTEESDRSLVLGADGSAVQPVRCAPGACLRRWAEADGPALLHELGGPAAGQARRGYGDKLILGRLAQLAVPPTSADGLVSNGRKRSNLPQATGQDGRSGDMEVHL